ncbi:cyclase family protein [Chloroflexota bacterium]
MLLTHCGTHIDAPMHVFERHEKGRHIHGSP